MTQSTRSHILTGTGKNMRLVGWNIRRERVGSILLDFALIDDLMVRN